MPEVLIEVNELGKQYMKQMAVHNVSFQINRGMICGLFPSMAGMMKKVLQWRGGA